MLKHKTQKGVLKDTLKNSAVTAAGVIIDRAGGKALEKVSEKLPSLPPMVKKYGNPLVSLAVGASIAAFAKGKYAKEVQSLGIGIAGSAVFRIINAGLNGRLSGAEPVVLNPYYESDAAPLPFSDSYADVTPVGGSFKIQGEAEAEPHTPTILM